MVSKTTRTSAQHQVRVGIIGAGGIATAMHLPALRRATTPLSIVGIYDPVSSLAEKALTKFEIEQNYSSVEELLDKAHPDAIVICTPNDAHMPVALAALERGIHVLCEKPLANSVADAQKMADLAHQKNLITVTNFSKRDTPTVRYVADLVAQGELGEIYHLYLEYQQSWLSNPQAPASWRLQKSLAGSGSLGDLSSHMIDLASLLGGDISDICAQLHTFVTKRPAPGSTGAIIPVDVDDSATILANFSAGAVGTISSTRYATGRSDLYRVQVYGSKEGVIFENHDQKTILRGALPTEWRETLTRVEIPAMYQAPHPTLTEQFVAAVAAGVPMSPSFDEGLRCQKVLEAAQISAEERRWVTVATQQ